MKRYKQYVLSALLVWFLLPAYSAIGQQTVIEGAVKNTSGIAVEGAKVTLTENPDSHTTTNQQGAFRIKARPGQHLRVSSEGSPAKTVLIEDNTLTITIEDAAAERVPVGYDLSRSPEEITSAVATVGAEELQESMVMNPENALFGRLPGLMALGNGGLPPSNVSFYVRGRGTFSDSSPLVLVDGFEQPLSSLSINEIQSISVLKDAAALAKYGQQGANGVLLVKTKRGNSEGLEVTASFEQAFTQPTVLPQFLEAPVYARAVNEAHVNDGLDPRYSAQDLNAFDAADSPYLFPNVNWFDKVMRNSGTNSNYNMTFEGGNENIQYFAMMDAVFDNGLFGPVSRNDAFSTQAKYSRFNFRSNIDVNVTDDLLLKVDVSGNIEENNIPGGGNGPGQIFNALYSLPSAAFPVRTEDGSWSGVQNYAENPVATLTSTGYGQPNSRNFSLGGNLRRNLDEWAEGLSAEASVRYSNFNNFAEQHTKDFSYKSLSPVRDQSGNIVDTTVTRLGQDTDLDYNSYFSNERVYTDFQGKINYETAFGETSTLEGTLLFHQSGQNFDGHDNTFHRQNLVGNIHLGFSGKYFVNLVGSYSGSNMLAPGNKFAFFPAVSAGWLVSKEDFMQNVTFLDRLKLRGSWGVSGSDVLPANNPYEHAYENAPGYRFQNGNNYRGGFREGRLATSDFTFETSYKADLGIEATVFNNLDVIADVFYERRTNILTGTGGEISGIIGIAPALETNGIVENRGVEAGLNWQDTIGEVAYHIGGQLTFARNKIIEMNEQYQPHDYLKRTGRPVGQRFGLEAIGFFEDNQDIAQSPRQALSQVQPGDIKYKDQNGDGLINEFDEVPLGYASDHPEMYFSASLGLNYKGIGVSALFQGTGNYTAYLNTQSVFWPLQGSNTISEYYYNNRWTPQTAGSASFPRLTSQGNNNNFRPNSLWMADRSYVKLRTLEVSYLLPSSITESLRLNRIKILGRGMNLFSIDNIPVLDPEQLSAGYPVLRSYNLGVEIAF